MNKSSLNILRVGIAITFLWIGVLIFKEPEVWGKYLVPWALHMLPIHIREAMIATAILDIAIGALLLFDTWVWLAATAGAIHLIIVLTVCGITGVTVRDIGILAGVVALLIDSLPKDFTDKIKSLHKKKQEGVQ